MGLAARLNFRRHPSGFPYDIPSVALYCLADHR